jgi:hypothetical protein
VKREDILELRGRGDDHETQAPLRKDAPYALQHGHNERRNVAQCGEIQPERPGRAAGVLLDLAEQGDRA